MKIITYSEEDNLAVAKNFLESLPSKKIATVVGLYGNLGAGKTAFTKAVAKNLGIEDTVTSPTFVIEKIYELSKNSQHIAYRFKYLIHIDAYRLDREEELLHLGWNEIIQDSQNLILIEWPERVLGIMPEHIKVKFTTLPEENSREIEIEG